MQSRLSEPLPASQMPSEIGAINPPPTKYGNHRVVDDQGRRFDSKLELRYAQRLDLEWQAGTVAWYTRQVPFLLEGGITYRADFLVVRPDPFSSRVPPVFLIEVIDCKGVMTQGSRNKMRQVHARYGITVQIARNTTGNLLSYIEVPVTRKSRD